MTGTENQNAQQNGELEGPGRPTGGNGDSVHLTDRRYFHSPVCSRAGVNTVDFGGGRRPVTGSKPEYISGAATSEFSDGN